LQIVDNLSSSAFLSKRPVCQLCHRAGRLQHPVPPGHRPDQSAATGPGAGPMPDDVPGLQYICFGSHRCSSRCTPGDPVLGPVSSGWAPGQPAATGCSHWVKGAGSVESARCALVPRTVSAGPAGVAPGATRPYAGLSFLCFYQSGGLPSPFCSIDTPLCMLD
jgi:hypothetical protein